MNTLIRIVLVVALVIAFAIYVGCFIAYGDGDDKT